MFYFEVEKNTRVGIQTPADTVMTKINDNCNASKICIGPTRVSYTF